MQEVQGQNYDFQARPRVMKPKSKYREQQQYYEEEDPDAIRFQNMMYDKRVVRGNTYAAIVTSKNNEMFQNSMKMTKSFKKPLKQLDIDNNNMNQMEYDDPGTPQAVEGRVHAALQTDEYVEVLTDKPPNYEKDTQTDFYIDRPLVRIFMPKKEGTDRETQIFDGDLFDFDYEVQPILQVLIGKTLEQSRMEVLEEEELRIMKEQQKRFEQLRNAELAEMQKLESKENRLLQENQNRINQYKAQKEQKILAHKKMISRIMSKNHLGHLQDRVLVILKDKGVFRHPLHMTLLNQFVPWLYQEVETVINSNSQSDKEVNSLIKDVVELEKQLHVKSLQQEKERKEKVLEQRRLDEEARQARIAAKQEAKRQKLEKERRQKIKEQVIEQLVSKGDIRPNVLSQVITEMDQTPEGPAIGLFGGVMGEFFMVLQFLDKLSQDDASNQGLKEWLQNEEAIQNVFKEIVTLICQEGGLELVVNEQVDQQLNNYFKQQNGGGDQQEDEQQQEDQQEGQQEGEGDQNQLNINNWHLAPEEQMNDIYQIIQNNMNSTILSQLGQVNDSLQSVNFDIVSSLSNALLKLIYNEDGVQQKIKWRKQQIKNNLSEYVGIAHMKPDLSQLQVNERSARYGEVQEPQNEEEEEDPKPVVPENLAEADYENKQTIFQQQNEEIKVLVMHSVAELTLREEILKLVSQTVASLQGREFQLLQDSIPAIQDNQENVLGQLTNNLPILDMDTY